MTTTVEHEGSISRIQVGAASATLVFAVVLLLVFISTPSAQAQLYQKVLYSFKGGNDGKDPRAGLIDDTSGNLYGTTRLGGFSNSGTVFKVDLNGNETVLYSFSGGQDGANPSGELCLDSKGNFYGTTESGGGAAQTAPGPRGSLDPSRKKSRFPKCWIT